MKLTLLTLALFWGSTSALAGVNSSRLESRLKEYLKLQVEASSDFVRVEGGQLKLHGKPFVFAGSNFYRLALSDAFGSQVTKEDRGGRTFFPQIDKVMEQYSAEGVKVLRFWGFSCEGSRGTVARPALLRKDFSFDEEAWKQLDFTLASARRHGIKVILPLVNFEHEYCGMEWWVEQTALSLGNGAQQGFSWSCYDQSSHTLHKLAWNREECRGRGEPVYTKELFFTHEKVWERYEAYVKSLLNRVNPYTGVAYKDDPTIFGIELSNEPHTSDYYECMITKVGELDKDTCASMNPSVYASTYSVGSIVNQWLRRASAMVKSIDPHHLVLSGEEGYRVGHDDGSCLDRHQWIHNGLKGVDFARNAAISTIDVMTTHLYPDNWGVPVGDLPWFDRCVVQDRARIARSHGKPIIMEETGFSEVGYPGKPDDYRRDKAHYISRMNAMTGAAGFQGFLVWQTVPLINSDVPAEDDSFTAPIKFKQGDGYTYTGEGRALQLQVQCAEKLAKGENANACLYYCAQGQSLGSDGLGRWPTGDMCTY